jgi:O-antigen/teichoic acid export membrane protein
MLPTLRNVAIIALLALAIAVLPGGGAAAETMLTAISMAFLAAIAFFVYRLYREQQMTMLTLSDGRRAILFGAVGAIALLIVGFEEFTGWAGGFVVWLVLMLGALGAIFLVWRETTSYT